MTTTIVTGSLHRVQRGHGKRFVTERPAAEPVHSPSRVALTLALAHSIERMISERRVVDQAEVARRLGLTRARITHLVRLTFLAPDLQEFVLDMEAVDGQEPISERPLRQIASIFSWREQRQAWHAAGLHKLGKVRA